MLTSEDILMPPLDIAAAVLFLTGTVGWLVWRAMRGWLAFRRQEKVVRLLASSVSELERPRQPGHR